MQTTWNEVLAETRASDDLFEVEDYVPIGKRK